MAPSKSILIVDDDIELGALLAKAIGTVMSDEFTIKIARDVDEAMVQLRRAQTGGQAFDLIITDIKMSGLSGLELLEALQSIAPQTKTIAMTAYNSPDIAGRADELGVYAFLTKPFVLSEFHQAVRQALDAPLRPTPSSQLRDTPANNLLPRQRVAVSRALGSLRAMTGADAALVVHRDGTVIAVDVLGSPKPVDDLGAELQAALRAIADQMTRAFDQDVPVRQSYFGTEARSVCTYRIDETYTAAVAFGPAVRQGQVWYYLREAAQTLEGALDGQAPPLPPRREPPTEDVFDLLKRFFPEMGGPAEQQSDAPPPPAIDGTPDPAPDLPEARSLPVAPPAAAPESRQQPAADPEPPAQPGLEDLNWDVDGEDDWSALVDGAGSTTRGLTLDQARQRGLIGDLDEN